MAHNMEELRTVLQGILQCPVCKNRLEAPVYGCNNGNQSHAICLNCRNGNNYCPQNNCNQTFKIDPLPVLSDIVKAFYFNCKYSNHSCEEIAAIDDLKKHEIICDYRTVQCIFLKNGKNCTDEISLPKLSEHVETYHDSFIRFFTLNSSFETILPKKNSLEKNNCHFRILKDDDKKIFFLEMTHYDQNFKIYQISVHYIGKQSEANNYTYTIEVLNKTDSFQCYKYSNKCLANLMPPDEVRKFYPFILFDQDERFSVHEEVSYCLKIERNEDSNNRTSVVET